MCVQSSQMNTKYLKFVDPKMLVCVYSLTSLYMCAVKPACMCVQSSQLYVCTV